MPISENNLENKKKPENNIQVFFIILRNFLT